MAEKKFTIGVMVGNASSSHTIDIVHGICDSAREADVNVLFFLSAYSSYFISDYFENQDQENYDFQSSCVYEYSKLCDVDAIIVSYGTLSLFLTEKEKRDLRTTIADKPTIYIETKAESETSRYIIVDHYTGYKQLMDHLINVHGYKNIVHIAGPIGNFDADERRRAYTDAMSAIGQPPRPGMIEFGDFSNDVHDKVNRLLDNYPDVEVIAVANDLMATCVYEVLKKREKLYNKAKAEGDVRGMERYKKHKVGEASKHTVAVTGYDNDPESVDMDPPLTTVAQSAYSMGFMAVTTAIGLVANPETTDSVMALPKLILRESCGCEKKRAKFPMMNDHYRLHPEEYAEAVAGIYTERLLPVEINESISKRIHDIVYEIVKENCSSFYGLSGDIFTLQSLIDATKEFIEGEEGDYIQKMSFISALNDLTMGLIKNTPVCEAKDLIVDIKTELTDLVYSKLLNETRDRVALYQRSTWFMPQFSRDMSNNLDKPEKMYSDAMGKLDFLGIGDSFLFLLPEPIRHDRNDTWVCPKELRLVASAVNGKINSYSISNGPAITGSARLRNYILENGTLQEDGSHNQPVIFALFSGNCQYGIMVCRCKPDDILTVYYASVQIATALKYAETANAQQRAQRELEHIVKEVEEKNEILRSLSEYDQLTGCYNRRGFFEKGLKLVRENPGRQACLVFADLDHLKEINDKYGHSEGDYAIESIAKTMRRALPDSAIIARLGGDEFVSIFLLDDDVDAEGAAKIVLNIRNASVNFNSMSIKPFYVECSAGHCVFTCQTDTTLEEMLSMADASLYDEKKKRRGTIVKKVTVF